MSDQGTQLNGGSGVDPGAGAAVVSDDDVLGAAFDKIMVTNGADRGAGGKFVSSSPSGVGDEGNAGAGDAGADAAGDAAPTASTAASSTPAPAHLPQNIKAIWGKLDAADRGELGRFVASQDAKFGEIGGQFREVKPFHDEFVNAMRAYPEWKGVAPAELAKGAVRLAAIQADMDRGPESAVKTLLEIANTYKVMPLLAQVFGGDGKQLPAGQNNSTVAALEAKIARLEAQVGNPESIRMEISKTMAEKDATAAFSAFAENKEHLEAVLESLPTYVDMVLEKSKGQQRPHADVLADAYDMAINANPEIRAKVRAAEAQATAAKPDPKRTDDARKAASINVKPNAIGKPAEMTEDQAFAAAYERATAH
jgi:hypothetical protein